MKDRVDRPSDERAAARLSTIRDALARRAALRLGGEVRDPDLGLGVDHRLGDPAETAEARRGARLDADRLIVKLQASEVFGVEPSACEPRRRRG